MVRSSRDHGVNSHAMVLNLVDVDTEVDASS
jgi:hypothetical protein